MVEVLNYGKDPDTISRDAGTRLYGTKVGMLRRSELWRLGNAWGFNFPPGCSKDFMIPFFINLEAENKDPFSPPNAIPDRPTHEGDSHAETYRLDEKLDDPNDLATINKEENLPSVESIRERLMALNTNDLKKMVKARGLKQARNDPRELLVKKLITGDENITLEEDD